MANQEHLARLGKAIAAGDMTAWNHWRQENKYIFPDLARADISGAYLMGANFTDGNLSRAHLRGANLTEANLSRAHLRGANLKGANLKGANLRAADLTGAILIKADLTAADLTKADLTAADLAGANLAEAKELLQEQIDGTYGNDETKLPPNLQRPGDPNWSAQ
jgi:uncharacterized protein YjbI with pentapeptide repeats